MCTESLSFCLCFSYLMSPAPKNSILELYTTAIAHNHFDTKLLPSFHSHKQKNVLLLYPFFICEGCQSLSVKGIKPQRKTSFFFFFYKEQKVNISIYWATDRGIHSVSPKLFCWSMQWTFQGHVYTQFQFNVDSNKQKDQIFKTSSADYFCD